MLKNIPIYEAFIENYDTGIYKISLVDSPAVESNFVYFGKEKQDVKFTIQDEEQRMVTGVIMRADFYIYRYSDNFGEYYMRFSKETIKKMAKQMMMDKTFDHINLQHQDGTDVDNVHLIEIFIKDSKKGISPKGFEDIEEGSLFATYKIDNDTIWQQIKDGTFKGFSIEAIVDLEHVQMNKQKAKKSNYIMNLFNKIFKRFIKFGSVETDKGELYWVGDADLQIGDELFYNTEDEEAVKVEDGEYFLQDGTKIVVTDGLVSAIEEKTEQADEPDVMAHVDKCNGSTMAHVDKCNGSTMAHVDKCNGSTTPDENDDVTEPDTRYDELKAEVDALKDEVDKLKEIVKEIKATPMADPIVEEFENKTKSENGAIPVFGSRSRIKR